MFEKHHFVHNNCLLIFYAIGYTNLSVINIGGMNANTVQYSKKEN